MYVRAKLTFVSFYFCFFIASFPNVLADKFIFVRSFFNPPTVFISITQNLQEMTTTGQWWGLNKIVEVEKIGQRSGSFNIIIAQTLTDHFIIKI